MMIKIVFIINRVIVIILWPVSLYSEVVAPCSSHSSQVTSNDWDQPPVIVLGEHPGTPACQHGEEARSQVSSRVDSVATVVTQTETQTQDSDSHPH